MAVRIKVDEDLPRDFSITLRSAGYDALSVAEQGLTGSKDEALWSKVRIEKRCFLTADKGFANARDKAPGSHSGVVLFRLPRESRAGYIRLLDLLLARFNLNEAVGAIVTISPDSIRIHRAP